MTWLSEAHRLFTIIIVNLQISIRTRKSSEIYYLQLQYINVKHRHKHGETGTHEEKTCLLHFITLTLCMLWRCVAQVYNISQQQLNRNYDTGAKLCS